MFIVLFIAGVRTMGITMAVATCCIFTSTMVVNFPTAVVNIILVLIITSTVRTATISTTNIAAVIVNFTIVGF